MCSVHIQSATCSMRALNMTLPIILHESHMSNSCMCWAEMIFTCKRHNVTTLSISMCSCKIFRDNKIDTHCYGMVLSFSDQYSNFHNKDSIWRCPINIRISIIEIRFSTMVSFQYHCGWTPFCFMYDPKCSTTFPWCTIDAPGVFAWCTINAPAVFAWCTNHFVHKVEFSYIGWNGVHPLWVWQYPLWISILKITISLGIFSWR